MGRPASARHRPAPGRAPPSGLRPQARRGGAGAAQKRRPWPVAAQAAARPSCRLALFAGVGAAGVRGRRAQGRECQVCRPASSSVPPPAAGRQASKGSGGRLHLPLVEDDVGGKSEYKRIVKKRVGRHSNCSSGPVRRRFGLGTHALDAWKQGGRVGSIKKYVSSKKQKTLLT